MYELRFARLVEAIDDVGEVRFAVIGPLERRLEVLLCLGLDEDGPCQFA